MAEKKSGRPRPILKNDAYLKELRRRAEESLRAAVPESHIPLDVKKLIHELRVYQTELEMQNEELREAQLKIQETTEKYYGLYDFAPVGYITLDRAGLVVEVNMTLARMLGVNKRELIGTGLRRFFIESDRDIFPRHLNRTFSVETLHRSEVRMQSNEGALFYVSLQSIANENGQTCRTAVVDVTGLRLAEQKLRTANERLRMLTEELSRNEEFTLRNIAVELHDRIGQNLAAVKMKIDLLRAPRKSKSRELNEISELLGETIRNTRSLTFEVSPAVLYELGFNSSIEWLVEKLAEEHGRKIIQRSGPIPEISQNLQIIVFRMIRELLMNSIKHSGADDIYLNMFSEGPNLSIEVLDRGRGFNPEEIEAKAMGFGLFSIRERIRSFGGTIQIKSRPGEGARVSLLIPAQ